MEAQGEEGEPESRGTEGPGIGRRTKVREEESDGALAGSQTGACYRD